MFLAEIRLAWRDDSNDTWVLVTYKVHKKFVVVLGGVASDYSIVSALSLSLWDNRNWVIKR